MSTVEKGSFLYVESQIISTLYCPKCKENMCVMLGVRYSAGEYYTRYYCSHCKKTLHWVS